MKQDLAQHEFLPVMPPELRAKKSVIITRVDDVIYEHDSLAIGEELVAKNLWIGEEIESVYKFPNTSTLKLTFSHTAVAKKCTGAGLKAFRISIPAHEIKVETYIPIQCCMRCYALESHYTNESPKPNTYKICSECSEEGHVWIQCKEIIKKMPKLWRQPWHYGNEMQ